MKRPVPHTSPGPVACLVFTRTAPAGAIVAALFRRGFTVIERPFSETFKDLLAEVRPDVILAALDVAEGDDLGVLRHVAGHGRDASVLALIDPYRDHLAMTALDAGAVAVLAGDAAPDLVAAQAAAMLRAAQERAGENVSEILAGDLAINLDRRLVLYAGTRVDLTKSEFDILSLLARNAGRVLGPAEIVGGIGQTPESPDQARGMVKVHISHLRTKLASLGAVEYVVTVRGVGYLFERREPARTAVNGEGGRPAGASLTPSGANQRVIGHGDL